MDFIRSMSPPWLVVARRTPDSSSSAAGLSTIEDARTRVRRITICSRLPNRPEPPPAGQFSASHRLLASRRPTSTKGPRMRNLPFRLELLAVLVWVAACGSENETGFADAGDAGKTLADDDASGGFDASEGRKGTFGVPDSGAAGTKPDATAPNGARPAPTPARDRPPPRPRTTAERMGVPLRATRTASASIRARRIEPARCRPSRWATLSHGEKSARARSPNSR